MRVVKPSSGDADFTCDFEEESNGPEDELPKSRSLEIRDLEDQDSEQESRWVAFTNPAPYIVKARFNVTEIEFPTDTEADDEQKEKDDELLKILIEEGIPVRHSDPDIMSKRTSNVGLILPSSDPLAEETLNLVPQSLELDNRANTSINNIDNIVEVTGLSRPISTPLFLHLVPSQTSLQEFNDPNITPASDMRRGSVNPSIILLPPETTTLPVKKKVRFDLPGRKASIIGEYEILENPVSTYPKRSHRSRRYIPSEESSDIDEEIEDSYRKRRKRRARTKVRRLNQEVMSSTNDDADLRSTRFFDSDDCDYSAESDYASDSLAASFDQEDTKCGIGKWTPQWLQFLARSEIYLILFCTVALAQGMLYSYNIAIISTVQKRFDISSSQAGFILCGNDISQIIISTLVAFYGTYGSRPRWLGIASICSAAAALIAAAPHFLYGSGENSEDLIFNDDETALPLTWKPKTINRLELCGYRAPENCTDVLDSKPNSTLITSENSFYIPQVLLFLSQLMIGVSSSVFWTVGVAYLDDNVSKRKTSIYIGFYTIARVVGPTVGMLLGSYCLSYWIDPTQEAPLSPRDPRWLGAWWLGFLLIAMFIGIPGICYFCFPRQLPRKNQKHYYIQSPLSLINGENGSIFNHKSVSSFDLAAKRFLHGLPSLRELPNALRRLFTNKIWTANMFSNVFFVLAMSGYWAFKPKYIQTQFRKSASEANFYTGMSSMIASVVGITASAIVIRWIRPRRGYITAYNVFLSIYAIISLFALMTIHCPSNEIAGHSPGHDKWACSEHCSCSQTFNPICAEDGVTTFYSPCFAGCTAVNPYVSPVEYLNCTCFGRVRWDQDSLLGDIPQFSINEGWALEGFCPDKCKALTIYLIILLVNKVVFATGRIGGTLINLRSVEEKDKTLALGCLAVFVSFAGFIPSSFVMGNAIDSACLVWNSTCGKKGSCSFYDEEKFRLVMHVIPAALLVLSGIGDIIVHVNNSTLDIYGYSEERLERNSENYEVKSMRKHQCKRNNIKDRI